MVCTKLFQSRRHYQPRNNDLFYRLNQLCLSLLQDFLLGPSPAFNLGKETEIFLIEELMWSVEKSETSIQKSLMDVLLVALKFCVIPQEPLKSPAHQRQSSREVPDLTINTDDIDRKTKVLKQHPLPPLLLDCLILGLSSPNSRPVLESWISFLSDCLPLYEEGIFQNLIPLVTCICDTLESIFGNIQQAFSKPEAETSDVFESSVGLLLNGLEQALATAHNCLSTTEISNTPAKTPEPQSTSFLSNMMPGVFATDTSKSRTIVANKRVPVLVAFKDAIRICYMLWSWRSVALKATSRDLSASASFNYITIRLGNRAKRIFEHLFDAEALDCLEIFVDLWHGFVKEDDTSGEAAIFTLLNSLESTLPRHTIMTIFNAMYSRSKPEALDPNRKTARTSDVRDVTLASFLVSYTRSLEDDAMDEIWNSCLKFLRDVLADPMVYRQTLFRLLEFAAVLGEKVDGTNFGEQRKLRRELGVRSTKVVIGYIADDRRIFSSGFSLRFST